MYHNLAKKKTQFLLCSQTKTPYKNNVMFLTFQLQYEFLYRAILNYAELHNLLEDS